MQVDCCYILAAGKGSRMGEVGQKLAKPLWPVFDRTLLEHQLNYVFSLGIKKIYINIHHLKDQVQDFIEQNKMQVQVLYEPVLLDVGGAIHNLKNERGVDAGNVLIINCDQFLFLSKSAIAKMLISLAQGCTGVLATTTFKKSDGYNGLNINGNMVEGVIKNSELLVDTTHQTYTGISLINLAKLKYISGVSNFFQSVCHKSQGQFASLSCDEFDFVDFGTLEKYCTNCFEVFKAIKENKETSISKFLLSNHSFQRKLIMGGGYACDEIGLNFTGKKIEKVVKYSIIISGAADETFTLKCESLFESNGVFGTNDNA